MKIVRAVEFRDNFKGVCDMVACGETLLCRALIEKMLC
jgi:hypothetical protein